MDRRALWKAEVHTHTHTHEDTNCTAIKGPHSKQCLVSFQQGALCSCQTSFFFFFFWVLCRHKHTPAEAKVKSCADLRCTYLLEIGTPFGFVKKSACQCKNNRSSLKRHISRLSPYSLSLCKAGKMIPIWGSLEQIRIVSTVGFYLFKQGRWIDNHHMPFWGPITQLCVKLENLFFSEP